MNYSTIAFLFPGQGAQAVGMGRDFAEAFPVARHTFEEIDDLLGRNLSRLIFEGPAELLTTTSNSQIGLYATSIALWRVLSQELPMLLPSYVAGLSLGEYSALTVAGYLPLKEGVPLVQARGNYMDEACQKAPGTMAVILGLEKAVVEQLVADLKLPRDLWVANINSPGQIVISGTLDGVAAGSTAALKRGAKKVIPLQVQGAFHSGLMQNAAEQLAPALHAVAWQPSTVPVALNVTGQLVSDTAVIADNLRKQVTAPVEWQKCIQTLDQANVDLFIEIGSGTTLTALNKRIGVAAPTYNLSQVGDLNRLASLSITSRS